MPWPDFSLLFHCFFLYSISQSRPEKTHFSCLLKFLNGNPTHSSACWVLTSTSWSLLATSPVFGNWCLLEDSLTAGKSCKQMAPARFYRLKVLPGIGQENVSLMISHKTPRERINLLLTNQIIRLCNLKRRPEKQCLLKRSRSRNHRDTGGFRLPLRVLQQPWETAPFLSLL